MSFRRPAAPLLLSGLLPALAVEVAAQDLVHRSVPGPPGPDAPAAPLLGERLPDLAFRTAAGEVLRLSDVAGERGLVLALREPDCPLSKRYGPRLARLEGELCELGFGLLYVETVDAEAAARDAQRFGLTAPLAVDAGLDLARALQAQTTTEVFVLDAERTLAYRGMVDDRIGLGFARAQPENEYLLDAVRSVARGATVATPATVAQGCLLDLAAIPAATVELAYHGGIDRIVQASCERCHRDGGPAPFALSSYDDVVERRRMIAWTLDEGVMPPWYATEGSGPWANDLGLTAAERADFLAWLEGGVPEGDPADAAPPRTWNDGWTIGEPDVVLSMPEPHLVPAEGVLPYHYAFVKTDYPEDRWVTAVEIRPGAREVVHHALVMLEDPEVYERWRAGEKGARREFQSGDLGHFASMVPGQTGLVFPEGTGKLLPAGAWLKLQLHYAPNGTAQEDVTSVGLVFADGPVEREVRTTSALNNRFVIPPGAFGQEVSASYRFEEAADLLSLFPHAHVRGVAFQYDLAFPDGATETLLELPFYDFDWQHHYELAIPRRVPAGTRMVVRAWYDNSADNPANPDPTATVTYGGRTSDEMMIGFVNWVPARDARLVAR
jgi:peroxiredoxin